MGQHYKNKNAYHHCVDPKRWRKRDEDKEMTGDDKTDDEMMGVRKCIKLTMFRASFREVAGGGGKLFLKNCSECTEIHFGRSIRKKNGCLQSSRQNYYSTQRIFLIVLFDNILGT